MRPSKKTIILFGITLVICVSLTYIYVLPIVKTVNEDMNAYATRIAYRDNYKLHTTPLSNTVVDDICSKLSIKLSSEYCQSNAVVYSPEIFGEVTSYFRNIPNEGRTYANVQNILGAYLSYCETPIPDGDNKGHYLCWYDFRGDKVYFVIFRFDENNIYYEVTAKSIPWDS